MARRDILYGCWSGYRGNGGTTRYTDRRKTGPASLGNRPPQAEVHIALAYAESVRERQYQPYTSPSGRTGLIFFAIIPKRPRALDRFRFVLGSSNLPVAAAFADIWDIAPTMLTMGLAQLFIQDLPQLLNRALAHIPRRE